MENEIKPRIELNSVTKKVFMIFGLAMTLMIPLSLVQNQISDRKEYEVTAQKEVAKGWGENVIFTSPAVTTSEEFVHATSSETTIRVDSKEKKRGVFRVPVYVATFKTKVSFKRPEPQKTDTSKNKKNMKLDKLTIALHPVSSVQGFKVRDLITGKVVSAKLSNAGILLMASDLPNHDFFDGLLEIEIVTRGTGLITYKSTADQDKVKMLGNWVKPQFVDEVLPTDTRLSPEGFEASWTLNGMPKFENGSQEVKSIGLNHLWIGTDYSMIERAIKYGILFIALTFLLVFIVEFMSMAKIHPFQYGMIGLSISIFYLLLLAFSETVGFHIAYLVSSLAVIGLIVFYVRGFLNQKKFVKMILIEQVVLSSFFYVLLSLEESSFLVGSLGLFTALAIFMIVTRKFDWYAGSFKDQVEE